VPFPTTETRSCLPGPCVLRYTSDVHLFGLTGGIASGKSTVASRLRARGVPVIDADALAREAVAPGTTASQEIRDAFGPGMFAADGSLDRKALAAVVFSSPEKRAKLNAITHPKIAVLSARCAGDLKARGEPLACYEAALLVENGLAGAFRPLVVVAAPEATQVTRALIRDGSTTEEAEGRIRAQMPLATKIAAADFVIHNDATLADLRDRTDATLALVCEQLEIPISRYPLPDASDEAPNR
jgi:dephospho-CoA kinase